MQLSGHFTSLWTRLAGLFFTGMPAALKTKLMHSFKMWCLTTRLGACLHTRPCVQVVSIKLPQWQEWGLPSSEPSLNALMMWIASSSRRHALLDHKQWLAMPEASRRCVARAAKRHALSVLCWLFWCRLACGVEEATERLFNDFAKPSDNGLEPPSILSCNTRLLAAETKKVGSASKDTLLILRRGDLLMPLWVGQSVVSDVRQSWSRQVVELRPRRFYTEGKHRSRCWTPRALKEAHKRVNTSWELTRHSLSTALDSADCRAPIRPKVVQNFAREKGRSKQSCITRLCAGEWAKYGVIHYETRMGHWLTLCHIWNEPHLGAKLLDAAHILSYSFDTAAQSEVVQVAECQITS